MSDVAAKVSAIELVLEQLFLNLKEDFPKIAGAMVEVLDPIANDLQDDRSAAISDLIEELR